MSKQAGRMSQGANDFLAPYAPTIGTATNVPSGRPYNDGRADVTFTANTVNAATSFTVTSSPGNYTATGASSPISITGLQSDTAYTFTVTATNAAGTSPASGASNSVTITTVPQAPSAPSASSPNANQDVVSWSAPANGGSAITGYTWASSDGKSGSTGSTSVTVDQEAGTAQTYTVYATNANGNSATSAASGSVTTTFSFVPFSVFGFSPFSVFGFSPFSVFGFSPFGFSPFGVFGFSPFGFSPFGFSPFGFAPMGNKGSLLSTTSVKTPEGLVTAGQLSVGDELVSVVLPNFPESGWTKEDVMAWSVAASSLSYDDTNLVTTTITSINTYQADSIVVINGDVFSARHGILINRGGTAQFVNSTDVLDSDLIWSTVSLEWLPVTRLETIEVPHEVISINCEPYDVFFTENMLVHDTNLDQ